MTNFLRDNTDLDFPKDQARVTAPGFENKSLRASDWNRICQAVYDIRVSTRNTFNVKTYGATGNGTTDDSVAIRAAITACASIGGGTVFFPNGTYKVSRTSGGSEGCLYPTSNMTLQGESRTGVIIKLANSQDGFTRPIRVDLASDVVIQDLTIDGNKSNQSVEEHRAGIFIGQGARVRIQRVTSFNNSGDGIDVWSLSTDTLIEDCYCYNNDRSGIALNGDQHNRVTIRKCQLLDNVAQQIDTEVDALALKNIFIEDCFLRSPTTAPDYALTLSGRDQTTQSIGFMVTGCVIEGPVYMVWAKNVLFQGNSVTTRNVDTQGPITVDRKSENVYIQNNSITAGTVTNTSGCILVQGASTTDKPINIVISDNYVNTNSLNIDGVVGVRPYSMTVANNQIIGSTSNQKYGVEVRATDPDAGYQVHSLAIRDNYILDFVKGILTWGVTAQPGAIADLIVASNVMEKINNTSFAAMLDLDFDNLHVVQKATVIGNSLFGVSGMFGGTYGGWPVGIWTLTGGNRGDRGVYSGTGTPESALTENVGAMALRRDGGANTTLYIKESGTGNTGWIAK